MIALIENGVSPVVEPSPIEKLKKTVSAGKGIFSRWTRSGILGLR